MYYTILTGLGEATLAAAQVSGTPVPLTHIALGDGNGTAVNPDRNSAMAREVYRAPISSITQDENNPTWIRVEAIVPADVGGWTVRELGLIGAEQLIAIGNFPDTYKPVMATENASRDLSIRMVIEVSSASSVSLTVDPSIVVATNQGVANAIAGHERKSDPHTQYLPKDEAVRVFAPLQSPDFAGRPQAPTQPANDASRALATCEFVANAIGTVRQPRNVTPAEGATSVSLTTSLTANAFLSLYGVAQNGAQFQVSKQQDFAAQVVVDSGVLGAVTAYAIAAGLATNTAYFWRVRYRDADQVWSTWSVPTRFATGAASINKPTITEPANGATSVSLMPTLASSAFSVAGGADTHASTDWQIWTGANGTGTKIFESLADAVNKTAITIPTGKLNPNTTYYARARHNGTTYGTSSWSAESAFISTAIVAKPSVTAPANNATGIDETPTLTSSAFAVTGGADTHASTDWQVWTGANGTGMKLFESLADAVNKLALPIPAGKLAANTKHYVRVRHNGAALGASAWSNDSAFTTMSGFVPQTFGAPFGGGFYTGKIKVGANIYALVVAPRSTGENPGIEQKPDATYNEYSSNADGWLNTSNMNNLQYPAFQWARKLTISGYTDWYIPAADELELMYRNLKPGAVVNNAAPNRGDGVATGLNGNSVPAGAAYTAASPAQTTTTAFRNGGAEAFMPLAYLSSSQFLDGAFGQNFENGGQGRVVKSELAYARAVRRILISS
jgi:hypothetical protein